MGLKQEDIADYLNVTREQVSYYETGSREVPFEMIPKLANLFGVDEYDLFEDDSDINNLNIAFAFRADEISGMDLDAIASFKKIALNYKKMKLKLEGE